jgi:hypothetical protein
MIGAAVLGLSIGCGGGAAETPTTGDGGLADASPGGDSDAAVPAPDAPPPPPPGQIAVLVTTDFFGEPDDGTRVLFSRPDGSVAADVSTDANGRAQAVLDAGYVTVVRNGPSGPSTQVLVTVLDVHAGDTIRIGPNRRFPTDPLGFTSVTHDPLPAGSHFRVFTRCDDGFGDAATPASLTVVNDDRCTQNVTVLAESYVIDNGVIPTGYRVLTGQTLGVGGSIAMPALEPAAPITTSITGLPFDVKLRFDLLSARSQLPGLDLDLQTRDVFRSAGTLSTTWQRPADGMRIDGTWIRLVFPDTSPPEEDLQIGRQRFAFRTGVAAQLGVPQSELVARWLLRPFVKTTPGQAQLQWTAETSDAAQFMMIEASYSIPQGFLDWRVFGPAPTGSAGTVTLPVLPVSLQPSINDTRRAHMTVVALDGGVSYADVRPRVAGDLYEEGLLPDQPGVFLALPNVSRLVISRSPE